MAEQLSMFSDPLEDRALEILRHAVETDLNSHFDSHCGGMLEDISYYFNPRDKCFYYSERIFNSYKPEPWVRRKTSQEINDLFIGG